MAQRLYKHAATQRTRRRALSVPTATNLLMSNAYLNPLLGHDLGSARAFSTTSHRTAVDPFAIDWSAPVNHNIKASIDRKASPRQKTPRSKPRSQKTVQAEQKPQLLQDLASSSTPESTEPALSDLTPADLHAKLADLAARLAAAKAVNWDELYKDAQESRSLKNHIDYSYKNMQHNQKVQAELKLAKEYEDRIEKIKEQKDQHRRDVEALEGSYAQLKAYVVRQNAKEQGEQGRDGEVNEHNGRREEVRRRKEEVLLKKDSLAVRIARLRAAQAGIQVSPATSDAVGHPDAVNATTLSASNLRIDLPSGTYALDSTTTFDINAAAPLLKKQIAQVQHRLAAFHPRLDALPSDSKPATSDKHTLQTYLKVLLGRYREKTGVLGVRDDDAEAEAEATEAAQNAGHGGIKELSEEAKQRIAERWNEMFSSTRGFVMTPELLSSCQNSWQVQKAEQIDRQSAAEQSNTIMAANVESARNAPWLKNAGAGAESTAKGKSTADAPAKAAVTGDINDKPQQRFEADIEEFNENGFLENEYATDEEVRATNETEEARLESAEPEQTEEVEEEVNSEVEETDEDGFADEEQAAEEMGAEEEAGGTTAQEPFQTSGLSSSPSNETIEANNTSQSTTPASTKVSPSPLPPGIHPFTRRPIVPIPTPGKPKTHAYFGRRPKIYSEIEKRLRAIEKKKLTKNPIGISIPVSPEVVAAIDAHLYEFFERFDERLKENKIEDFLSVGLMKKVKGGGTTAMRQDGKAVSPVFWAARFAVLKQERMRETSVWPRKNEPQALKVQDAEEKNAVKELEDLTNEAPAHEAPASTRSAVTAPITVDRFSLFGQSTRPARKDPGFTTWALNQLQGSPDEPETKEQTRDTLAHNYKAVKLGWGPEDDKIAAEGLPKGHRPDVKMEGYGYLKNPRYDPRTSSKPAVKARVQELLHGKEIVPETEEEMLNRDPSRKATIAAELKLLRRATTLTQDEKKSEAASGEAGGANTETQKPLITYESSLQPKGFVMKRQRGAVEEQKKKNGVLMREGARATRPGDARVHSASKTRPRQNLTVRSLIRRSYSTSSRPHDPLNQGLKEKEKQASGATTAPQTPIPSPAQTTPHLPHLTPTGSAHMVSISTKSHTVRTAIAVGTVYFSNPTPLSLIQSNSLKKGDVLGVSRIAGIMAAKKCPDIVPLCHPIPLTHVGVELLPFSASSAPLSTSLAGQGSDKMEHGGVAIECKVACTGATGVEMEALTAVMGAALSVVDMCKAVDKFQRIGDVRVVLKEGGKSGIWREEGFVSSVHPKGQ
ncbi:hypothetical protein N0V91_002120 [Didymella pomorum]|uniref:cyclic pyranopterin monophosphate synthase n=1 Tax=Didymella pomorum TaxID=749634 RepID=A0A9W8ZJQ4_9PLEO|nr:hypothetical protein N0V91_002120 [Didymella pomorum]